MFIPQSLLIHLIESGKYGHKVAVDAIKDGHDVALKAIQTENSFLKKQVEDLRQELKLEVARSQALVDRLLVRDAKVYPVTPMAQEAIKQVDAEKEKIGKVLSKVFDEISQVGENTQENTQEAVQVNFAGGGSIRP